MNRTAEGHGNSVDEAIQQALRQLGLTADQVFVEILSEGSRRGLFGGRRAHVRAIAKDAVVAPGTTSETTSSEPQQTEEDGVTANDQEDVTAEAVATRDEDAMEADGDGQARESLREQMTPEEWLDLLDQEAEMAADFVEGLLDRLDLPGDLEIEVTEDQALVNVQDLGSGLLIGRRGATLDALQELVRSAVQRQTQRRAHVRVDVEGYRARQL
ncbi:MAG TPA: Jag N-terminal domain-containing protein, partial [Egibacteraceae bacterium]|nr:Jag N-terminal domain-containing protein [Egibacteraceae bacterium]